LSMVEEKILGVEWVPGTGTFITVNSELCTGCGRCVRVCLGRCIKIREGKAVIENFETCFECGVCWFVCPENAIRFSWPKGGTGVRIMYG